MKKVIKLASLMGLAVAFCLSFGAVASAQASPQVQTNFASYVSNSQATLNGNLYINSSYNYTNLNYTWFEWGTTTSYGNQTSQQASGYAGPFLQQITNLSPNTIYHFRAAARGDYGTIYGQDLTFTTTATTGSGLTYYSTGTGTLTIDKKVINLTSGNLNWQASVNANPGDILSFAITMQADGQDIHNVMVRDVLPAGLVYKGNMTINASLNYSGDPTVGINIGTIPARGIEVISYQVQVLSASNLPYGTSTLTSNTTVTSSEAGTQTDSSSVILNNSSVYGATIIPTGITNNPVKDSFFLPMALIVLMSWLYFTGKIYTFADWLGAKM